MPISVPLPVSSCAATSSVSQWRNEELLDTDTPDGQSCVETSWVGVESQFSLRTPKQVTRQRATAEPPKSNGDVYIPSAVFSGQLQGYVYKSSELGLGYHLDCRQGGAAEVGVPPQSASSDFVVPLCLADLLRTHTETTINCARTNPRRRRRDQYGRRHDRQRRPSSRCQLSASPPHATELACRPPCLGNGRRAWAIDTVNASSFQSAVNAVVLRTSADIVLLQEHRLLQGQDAQARSRGWKSHLPPAWPTAAGRASAGVGIMACGGIGLAPHADAVPHEYSPRIAAAWVGGVIRGGIHCVSVYLRDSEGLSEANLAILTQLAALLRSLSGPWVVGGDWNIQPQQLQESRWLDLVRGTIHATSQPTCHQSTYDFFVVSATISHSVLTVQRITDAGLSPHSPVRLLLRGDARRPMVRRLVRPPRIEGALPHGPANDPDKYPKLRHAALDGSDINSACAEWYACARAEVASLTGLPQSHHAATFKWSPAAGAPAKRTLGATPLSVTWRVLAQRAEYAAASFARDDLVTARAHVSKLIATGRHVAKKAPDNVKAALTSVATTCAKVALTGSSFMFKSIANALRRKAVVLEVKARDNRLKAWREWLGWDPGRRKFPFAPSRDAYRWIRSPTGWAPSVVAPEVCNDAIPDEGDECTLDLSGIGTTALGSQLIPISDQAQVEREASEWAKQWAVDEPYSPPCFPPELLCGLPLVTPQQLREAASTFPVATGLGCDNFSPRAIGRLSDRMLFALAAIFAAAEKLGAWPDLVNLVLIVLLPKPDGGFRPIGLFPMLVRLWFRVRVPLMRAWESANAMPQMFGGRRMGAHRAAWVASFRAEAAAGAEHDHACNLLDLVKAFERIPHDILARAAAFHDYPIALLRLCLAAYRLARSIGIAGLYSRLIVATRGITAGSGSATTELRMLLLSLVRVVLRQWPQVLLTVYVDDLSVSMSGHPLRVAHVVGAATSFIIRYFEHDLRLEISAKKSVAVASRPLVARLLATQTRLTRNRARPAATTFKAVRATKLLGAACSGGRRRSTRTLQGRLKDLRRRMPRIRAFRCAGGNATLYARTAALPATTYGIEVQGMADTQLLQLRRLVANAMSPPTAGRNPILVHFVAAATGTDADPALLAHTLPICRWALAWWEAWVSQDALRQAFKVCQARMSRTTGWNTVTGPTAAAIRTAARIGWRFADPTSMYDDLGVCWRTLQDSPAAIAQAVQRSVRRWRFNSIVRDTPSINPCCEDESHMLLDVSDAIRPLFGKGHGSKTVPQWQSRDRPWLISASTGGQWTQTRKAAVRTWEIDQNCQLCHAAAGTLEHRHSCKTILPLKGWGDLPARAQRFNNMLGDDRSRMLRTRALLAIAIPRPPVIDLPCITWLTSQPDFSRSDLDWYTDGSVVNVAEGLPTAGCALVATDRSGALAAVAHIALPSKVMTAPHAELYAVLLLCMMLPFPARITTDCKGLVTTARGGLERATAPDKTLAAEWGRLASCLDGSLAPLADGFLVWAPAHCTLSAALMSRRSDGQFCNEVDWRANRLADAVAKAAARVNAAPGTVIDLIRDARSALAHAAAVLGAVTHAANHHPVSTTRPDGSVSTTLCRDAHVHARPKPHPRCRAVDRASEAADTALPPLAAEDVHGASLRLVGSTRQSRVMDAERVRLSRRRQAETQGKMRRSSLDEAVTTRIIAEMGAKRKPSDPAETGARFSALRDRIRRKELGGLL